MNYYLQQVDDEPIVIVKVYHVGNETQDLFQNIENHTSGVKGQDFVIYDCTEIAMSYTDLEAWLEAQGSGVRGSMTDPSKFTLLVGEEDVLQVVADTLERETYGGVSLGVYGAMDAAVNHARKARRLFAQW